MGVGRTVADLEAESEALRGRREHAIARLPELRARQASLVETKRVHERALIALDRRGLVGTGMLTAVASGLVGSRAGLEFGRDPNVVTGVFAAIMAALGLALAFAGWRESRKERAVLDAARRSRTASTTSGAPIAEAPPLELATAGDPPERGETLAEPPRAARRE